MDADDFCREIEAYLCRKNDGHLIRIVGPAFERVQAWAEQGIPMAVACEGIDRYFERYYRKGPRRRPVRIEFCEADVLDVFDTWRRAVGVAVETPSARSTRVSLTGHIERLIARLTALRASSRSTQAFDEAIEQAVRDLDTLRPRSKGTRGAARDEVIDALSAIDRRLMQSVMASLDEPTRQAARDEAERQLAPFRDRMSTEAYQQSRDAAAVRHVREMLALPSVTFE